MNNNVQVKTSLTLPQMAEFTTADVVTVNTSLSKASVSQKLNKMLEGGTLKVVRSVQSGVRGRPTRVFSVAN